MRFPDDEKNYLRRLSPTPLVQVQLPGDPARIWSKLEFLNPSGSTKDRIARFILERAWREGQIRPGTLVIEASSGSTSIAFALACAQFGIRFLAVMPEGVSNERVLMIRAYGGEIRLTPRAEGIMGAIRLTRELAMEGDVFLPCQFENPLNAMAQRLTTAREVADQIPNGIVDAVVSGVGTGGTIVGLYQGLRDAGCAPIPVAARPVHLSRRDVECCSFSAKIPGVVDCVSTIFCPQEMPGLEFLEIDEDEALETTRLLIREGFPVGASSGLNFRAAQIISRRLGPGAVVVTVFPDRMERYFSTELFAPMSCGTTGKVVLQ